MKALLLAALAVAFTGATAGSAATVYDNTSTDTLITYFYSTGPYSEIGDSVTLGGTERLLTSATVQFFNLGDAGLFDATLSFWETGIPVGAQIGSSFLQSGNESIGLDIVTVTFSNLNLLVPDSLVFSVAISNLNSNGVMDLGLNAFAPQSVGGSNNETIVTRIGSSDFETGVTAIGEGNLYLQLEATEANVVPEPATMMMAGAAMLALVVARKRAAK
jgi:hypothetical protein